MRIERTGSGRIGSTPAVTDVGATRAVSDNAARRAQGDARVDDGTGSSRKGEAGATPDQHGAAWLDKSTLDQMVEGLNRALQPVDKRLQFLVHETTGRIYVKVLNRETEEVIREIPPEKILDLVGHIHEMVGLLIDETV